MTSTENLYALAEQTTKPKTTMTTSWIGVDLDGTLAMYQGWKGITAIGEPIPAMVGRVKSWLAAGKDVRILTARVGPGSRKPGEMEETIQAIMRWCETHLGKALPVTCQKDFGMVELWDDRAVQVVPNEGIAVRDLLTPKLKQFLFENAH